MNTLRGLRSSFPFHSQIRAHVPEPPGHDPDEPPESPPVEPDREVDLPPREIPDPIRDPLTPPPQSRPLRSMP